MRGLRLEGPGDFRVGIKIQPAPALRLHGIARRRPCCRRSFSRRSGKPGVVSGGRGHVLADF